MKMCDDSGEFLFEAIADNFVRIYDKYIDLMEKKMKDLEAIMNRVIVERNEAIEKLNLVTKQRDEDNEKRIEYFEKIEGLQRKVKSRKNKDKKVK